MQFKKGRERLTDIVAEKLKLLPDSPGVYIMKDASGRIIYVGKAVVLKNRVRQYFQHNKNHSPKVKAMVSHIADFEIIMTHSEVEALILECNLIKKHRPHYNISLKDDKSYPYVKVTVQEEYPRVFLTHRVTKDGARYFGPYTDVTAVHQSLKLLRRLFPLRTCRHLQDRPCLEYHIKRCLAPCVGKVTKEDYAAMIRAVLLFLEGRTEDVERELKFRMEQAAAAFHFETAARLRDQLRAVQKIAEKQNIVTGAGDQDAIGIARSEIGVCVQVFFIRAGKMIGARALPLAGQRGGERRRHPRGVPLAVLPSGGLRAARGPVAAGHRRGGAGAPRELADREEARHKGAAPRAAARHEARHRRDGRGQCREVPR